MNLSNLVISAIRTYTPLLVGYVLTLVAQARHIVIDSNSEASLVALTVAVLTAAYWTLVRLLERRWPKLGVLLGIPAQPKYTKPQP